MDITREFIHDFADFLISTFITMSEGTVSSHDDDDVYDNELDDSISKRHYYWKNCVRKMEDVIHDYEKEIRNKSRPILHNIIQVDQSSLNTKESLEVVFHKIISFIILYSGMGSPSHADTIRETYPSLNSVFKPYELLDFVELSNKIKEDQLMEITHIVMGIRIFNKDSFRGGQAIEDLPENLEIAVKDIKDRIKSQLKVLNSRCENLVNVLDIVFNLTDKFVRHDDSEPYTVPDLKSIKNILCLLRQHEYYLRDVMNWTTTSEMEIETLAKQLKLILLDLHNLLKYRSAVATKEVFPLFIQLGLTWREMQYQAAFLNYILTVMDKLDSLTEQKENISIEDVVSNFKLKEDLPKDDLTAENLKKSLHPHVKFIPENLIDELKYPLEIKGFCAWALIKSKGGLIPGNVGLGVLEYKKKRYAFLSYKAAYEWGIDPEKALELIRKILKDRSSIALFLDFDDTAVYNDKSDKSNEEPITNQIGVQTEIHPIKSYIDPDYCFSEWELRRRALKLARLRKCATKSTQTVGESVFRLSTATQVWTNNDKKTQVLAYDVSSTSSKSSFRFPDNRLQDENYSVSQLEISE